MLIPKVTHCRRALFFIQRSGIILKHLYELRVGLALMALITNPFNQTSTVYVVKMYYTIYYTYTFNYFVLLKTFMGMSSYTTILSRMSHIHILLYVHINMASVHNCPPYCHHYTIVTHYCLQYCSVLWLG